MAQTEAQKRARDKYNAKNPNKYKTIGITLPATEAEQHRDLMAMIGATPVQVWREGIKAMFGTASNEETNT